MECPEVRYAQTSGVNIAYQVVGDGPIDLLHIPGWISHLDLYWEEPTIARFLRRLGAGFRLILFDRRGTGLSDRVPDDELPALEGRMDEVRTVLDAAASEEAALVDEVSAFVTGSRAPVEPDRVLPSCASASGIPRPEGDSRRAAAVRARAYVGRRYLAVHREPRFLCARA